MFIEVVRQLKVESDGETVNPIVEVQVLNDKKYTTSKKGISGLSVVNYQEHLFFEPKSLVKLYKKISLLFVDPRVN